MINHFDLDRDACYRALQTRDARFDGRFYTAVLSTGIYCRPICPARPPKIENCVFVPSAGAAHQMGFRPCLRCRPELTPGVAGWLGTANTVSRALQLIAEGAMNEAGVDDLSDRLGVTARHLRRLFDKYVGATPVSVAQAQRILFAKKLLGESKLSMTDVALAAGFGSLRRFNHTMRETYGRPPTQLRRSATSTSADMTLKLHFNPPYDWPGMIGFLAARAIPGVEAIEDDCYWRTFSIDRAEGAVCIRPNLAQNHLLATIWISDVRSLAVVVTRLRRLFDLDADIQTIDENLASDSHLAQWVRERPGLRVPGAWEGFELAVRAVLGQQISVSAASTFAGRLAKDFGRPLKLVSGLSSIPTSLIFPTPASLASADLTLIGLTKTRAETLCNLAAAMTKDSRLLSARETLDETIAKIEALPGIGPWTAQYIAMRALREPDAFPASDFGLLRAKETEHGHPSPAQLQAVAEAWRPWRAYAAVRLWTQGPRSGEAAPKIHHDRKRPDKMAGLIDADVSR